MESTPFSALHVTIGDAFEFLWFLVGFWLGERLFVGCFTVLSALLCSYLVALALALASPYSFFIDLARSWPR